mmetsp:Transcript_48400/g.104890  ORF Transcript_48400/g.104890 Transcript_48400/m.104890 type:complete len:164 (-) Transcript_48400:323-814(-)
MPTALLSFILCTFLHDHAILASANKTLIHLWCIAKPLRIVGVVFGAAPFLAMGAMLKTIIVDVGALIRRRARTHNYVGLVQIAFNVGVMSSAIPFKRQLSEITASTIEQLEAGELDATIEAAARNALIAAGLQACLVGLAITAYVTETRAGDTQAAKDKNKQI